MQTVIEDKLSESDIDAAALRADTELLDVMTKINVARQPRNELELSWHQLKLCADHAQLDQLDDEFHALFIGLGHGEVIPYGSWYQTGYLMDKPLARLRHDLNTLGIERQTQVSEPEDHIAAILETMAILIQNDTDMATQQAFFQEHLHNWLAHCFDDIEQAPSANFYKAVAQLGRQFVDLEARYLDVLDG
jgi:TorA maturation chaperone TorD